VFAPLNKQAMHLGGSPFPDELHFMADRLGWTGHISEINVLENLWTSRVTSHIGLSKVSGLISKQAVLDAILLIHDTLKLAGVAAPRLLVAALNPHGGEGGLFGREELDHIAPAVEEAKARGIQAAGPFPADTIFLRAKAGRCDAVVSMYHDQGQIAMKLMGFERGVSVRAGSPPCHDAGARHRVRHRGAGQGEPQRPLAGLPDRLPDGRNQHGRRGVSPAVQRLSKGVFHLSGAVVRATAKGFSA
jgi:4-hydroxythreonine-4-phosphate dehydrogenase